MERRRSSKNSSNEFLWSIDCKTQLEALNKNSSDANTKVDPESALASQARLTKEQRLGSARLSRHQSLEEEFERAKAAVEEYMTLQPVNCQGSNLMSDKLTGETHLQAICLRVSGLQLPDISHHQGPYYCLHVNQKSPRCGDEKSLGTHTHTQRRQRKQIPAAFRGLGTAEGKNLKVNSHGSSSVRLYFGSAHNDKAKTLLFGQNNSDTEFWDKMQAEWEELARRNWLTENEQAQIPSSVSPHEKGYYFHTDNPYKDLPNAFDEGQKKSREGDLQNAVLMLEGAVLQDPQDSEAWQVLGTTQAENENEQSAIVSLQRCLELHPNNLTALMALAVSLTNTGMRNEACETLLRWLQHSPKYKHLLKSKTHLMGSPNSSRKVSTANNVGKHESSLQSEAKELFLEAVQQNSESIDPDLQTGLGVLYNVSGEFKKAVDAFNTALSVRPEDYLLWNRLGATLANGDRSEEAVEAYTRALELQPGFIRSRYNLGISCINLGAHREAARNFLTALSLQRKSRSRQQSHQVMSGNIWAALRIALSMMDQPELFQAANIGDLDLLMRAFNLDI
ncbi:hypothetical protein NQZ68_029494 [Dissostichus eleginoides]|nr:hypothetical protein NQZ68_029494 [Dissostichus eleginoides]